MVVLSVKIKFFVLELAALICSNTLSAQDINILKNGKVTKTKLYDIGTSVPVLMQSDIPAIKYEIDDTHIYNVTDTMNRQLHYSHNFQSGIPAMDNYLDIKIIDATGKKMKKADIRSTLADLPEALAKYNTGVRLYTAAAVLGITSIGILAVRLSNPEDKRLWMWAGIGCSTGVIICRLTGTAKLKSAINLHNEAKANRHTSNLSLDFGVPHSGGLGLILTF
jgi:hypothetical protein